MDIGVGRPEIGQWYAHLDKGGTFQVIGLDEHARTIEVQSFGGDLDEIDAESWVELPLARAEPPEDWTGPIDDVEHDDLGYTETAMMGPDWQEPLQPFRIEAVEEEEEDEDAEEAEPDEDETATRTDSARHRLDERA